MIGRRQRISAGHTVYLQRAFGLLDILAYIRHYGSAVIRRKIFQGMF